MTQTPSGPAGPPLPSLLVLAFLAGCGTARSYEGSPQWRDGRFHNPKEWPVRPGIPELFRWQFSGRPDASLGFVPKVVKNDGARLRADRETFSLTFMGHATVLVQGGGVSVLTDPVFSRYLGFIPRLAPPGVAPKDLPPIDVVVISHNHRDHLDEASVRALSPRVHYVVPLGLASWFRARGLPNVSELDWWQSTTLTIGETGRRVTLTLVPAQHWSQREIGDAGQSLWGGYVIELAGRRVYFAGDTGYPAAFREIGRRFPSIDYALVPIGAYAPRWFMRPQHIGPEEAAQVFREVGARAMLPIHWGTFCLSDEPMDEPPRLLLSAMGADAGRVLPQAIGETYFEPSVPQPERN